MVLIVNNDDIHVFSDECYGRHYNSLLTKSLEIPMGQSEAVIQRIDNKMSKKDKQIKQSFQKNRKLLIEHMSNTHLIKN